MPVVAVVLDPAESRALTRWAVQFGGALEESVEIVRVDSEPEMIEAVDRAVAELPSALVGSNSEAAAADRPSVTVHDIPADSERSLSELADEIKKQVTALGANYLLVAKQRDSDKRRRALVKELFERISCRVVLLRVGDSDGLACREVLVPASGGSHATVALRVGARLADHAAEGSLIPFYVEPPFTADAQDVGDLVMKKILKAADLADAVHIEPRVVVAHDPAREIARAAESAPDLILMGASEAGAVRRTLFGTIPDRSLRRDFLPDVAVGVIRERRPLTRRVRERLENWLDLTIPQLSREERVDLFETIRRGSRWQFDFVALIGLSTAIATLGLLQNSAAVVIGAMLVAPLMTPLLGAGVAVVQGNFPLLRSASLAIVFGFLFAVGIGWSIGVAVPLEELTDELAARGGPTILDLGIAFLSGVAAAYCLGRPNLSAALPGVAIAAALVPPIATVGVSVSLEAWENARGAALLFGTNVVAIVLGGAFSLYAGGIRPKKSEAGARPWARYVVLGLLIVSIPLTWALMSSSRRGDDGLTVHVCEVSADWSGVKVLRTRRSRGTPTLVEVWVRGKERLSDERLAELDGSLERFLQRPVRVRVVTELATESR